MVDKEIKVECQVDPAVNLCCVNSDCVNCVTGQWVCSLKIVTIGPDRKCAAFIKKIIKSKVNGKKKAGKT